MEEEGRLMAACRSHAASQALQAVNARVCAGCHRLFRPTRATQLPALAEILLRSGADPNDGSLYFAVAGLMAMFRYLRYSLVLILAFVGMKMLLVSHYHVPNHVSLAIILATLGIGILASIWATHREAADDGNT